MLHSKINWHRSAKLALVSVVFAGCFSAHGAVQAAGASPVVPSAPAGAGANVAPTPGPNSGMIPNTNSGMIPNTGAGAPTNPTAMTNPSTNPANPNNPANLNNP